jgi:SOS-response transcriptional repressor LexA
VSEEKVVDNEVVAFIDAFTKDTGYCPSVRDVQERFRLSSAPKAQGVLRKLKEKGLVDWVPGVARTLQTVKEGK